MLGYRLTELRRKRNFSQAKTAKKLGIPRSTYSNYENDNREPDLETLKKLAEFYEVSVDDLLGFSKKEKSDNNAGLSDEAMNFVVKEICKKYNIDPTDPKKRENLENIIKIVYGERNE